MSFWLAFFTGLTAGGLGCLAVQGGLLASSLAYQAELDGVPAEAGQTILARRTSPYRHAQPILLFLLAKLTAYTALGFLLGACGALFQITPRMRAALMVVIGLFMLGNGLRLLNVHPVFRRFVITPPAAITAYIRRTSKHGVSLFTPLFLGGLTVLLPCGITQAMMAAALATGQPLQGAALLFSFVLGTSPLFFLVAYFATRLGATLETQLHRVVALILIVLGSVSCVFGLNLAGLPVAWPRVLGPLAAQSSKAMPADSLQDYRITISNQGYSPAVLHLPANKPVSLVWVTSGNVCCAQSVVVPGLNYQVTLPVIGQTLLAIPAQSKNTVLNYSCSMGRRVGQLVFDVE
jgi:sulfite exporter TauE/SafE